MNDSAGIGFLRSVNLLLPAPSFATVDEPAVGHLATRCQRGARRECALSESANTIAAETLDATGRMSSGFHRSIIHDRPAQASFVGALAIADLVKSTLGPKGMVGTGYHHC